MTRINFLAPRLPSRHSLRIRRLTRTASILLLLIAVTVLALLGVLTSQSSIQGRIASIDAALAAEAANMAEWQSISAQVKEAENREMTLALIPEAASRFGPLIRALDEQMPSGCSLLHVVVDSAGEINLMGSATGHSAVATYLDRIRALPGIEGAELQSAVLSGGQITFRVHALAAGAAESEGGQNE